MKSCAMPTLRVHKVQPISIVQSGPRDWTDASSAPIAVNCPIVMQVRLALALLVFNPCSFHLAQMYLDLEFLLLRHENAVAAVLVC